MLVVLQTLSGCDRFDHDYNTPEPSTLDHHAHTAILHFRTINHSADTLGIVGAVLPNGYLMARRDASPAVGRNWSTPAHLPDSVQIAFPDTISHACTLEIAHYVGYQLRYGGDTTRFSSMDRYGMWVLQMVLSEALVVFDNGETLGVNASGAPDVPDTVRTQTPYELDVTVNMDGLLDWQAAQNRYDLRGDHVTVRQR